ncbi:MAG: sulfite exporter TauE/SafE family protein [Gemmatimonadales bacterium]|nr:sulfite exporter TauE/SafE family protein [Gemmatimonadales bacterium]
MGERRPTALRVIGLIASVLSGLFGIGGGVVFVPALVLLGSMAAKEASGTSLASLLTVGALGAWQYYRNGLLDLRAATLIALELFLGALVGARLALRLPARDLQPWFAVFLVALAIDLWVTAK